MRLRYFLPLLLLPVLAQAAGESQQAREWLGRMAESVQHRDYQGTFVYFHDGELEAMKLVHHGGEQGGAEHLVSLSGEPREIIREGNVVKCYLPGRQTVIVQRGDSAMPLPARVPLDDPGLEKQYEFLLLGESRIAGRECRQVGIRPRDGYRFGYRLCLDEKTALPLKSELMTDDGEVVEQVMFTSLDILPDDARTGASDEPFQPAVEADDFTWHVRHGEAPEAARPATGDKNDGGWQAGKLPPGFVLAHDGAMASGEDGRHTWHQVYSDGLASVSVFAEPAGQSRKALEGLSRMGAMSIYGRRARGWQLTVVGEVPPRTVEMIGESLLPQDTPSLSER